MDEVVKHMSRLASHEIGRMTNRCSEADVLGRLTFVR